MENKLSIRKSKLSFENKLSFEKANCHSEKQTVILSEAKNHSKDSSPAAQNDSVLLLRMTAAWRLRMTAFYCSEYSALATQNDSALASHKLLDNRNHRA
ncbi:MAG: hypothetical protein LBR83_09230, partial [Clostridiales bacterium]|nr:hypothetical protein [Clostridiales bacterium]